MQEQEQHERSEHDNGSIGISDVVLFIWDARYWMVIPALIGVVVSIGLYLFTGLVSPSTTTYQSASSLTMLSKNPSEYPNGSPYAITDVRSPAVLAEVYRRNQVERYGMSLSEFGDSIGVGPYSPLRDAIADRFRVRLSNRQITAQEREAIESEFRTALAAASREGFLVSFTVPDNIKIPSDVGRKVASDVAVVWSEIFVEVLGVAGTTVPKSGAELIDIKLAGSLDYPLAFDYLTDSMNLLKNRLETIATVPGIQTAQLSDGATTIFDLQRRVSNLEAIYVNKVLRPIVDRGVSKNPTLTVLTYENQIERLKVDEQLQQKKAEIVSEIVAEGASADRMLAGVAPPAAAQPGVLPPMAGISIPQFGDSFIDRIVSMSLTGAGLQNRQDLLRQKLDYANISANLAKERQITEARVAAIRSFGDHETSTLITAFDDTMNIVESELNQVWKSANTILVTLDSQTLNSQGRLYAPVAIAQEELRSSFLASRFLALMSLAIIGGLAVFGLLLYSLTWVVQHRTSRGA